jgi:hypothetical protein
VTGGCGGSDDDGGKAPNVDFRGVYRPTGAGPIAAIAFTEGQHYMLMSDTCMAQSCAEQGKYTLDRARKTLSLTDAASGKTKTLPLEVLATTGLVSAPRVAPKNTLLPGSESQLTDGAESELTPGLGEQLVLAASALLEMISKANIGGQDMERDDGARNEDPPKEDGDPKPEAPPPEDEPKPDCTQGMPKGETTGALADAYWAKCPNGIR